MPQSSRDNDHEQRSGSGDDQQDERKLELNELAASHVELVQHIVNQVATRFPRHVDRGELWSAGAIGLVEASRSYNAETGVPFARFASIRIRGAIIDSTRKRDWAVRSLRRQMRELREAEERIETARGRHATDEEIAQALGISIDALAARRTASLTSSLLHLDHEDPDRVSLGERIIEEEPERLPDENLANREMIGTLRSAVEGLPELQRDVIMRYYIDGEMLQSIAESLNVTEARVSQIRAEAVNSMRGFFTTLYQGVADVPEDAPGRRGRAAYLATMATQSTWLARLEAADHDVSSGRTVHESEPAAI
ncbi:MAG: sigma-70 family RNA polymerase sigma factor [Actinobacteria bacterium]|nr:sigma-70 family RNA polymerase sigma factor [Actinomycetota bacterium]